MRLAYNADWQPSPGIKPLPDPGPVQVSAAGPETTYGLHAIARLLGYERRSEDWKADYVRALIAQEGFPEPLPLWHKGTLNRAVSPRKSRWLAVAVDDWLLRQAPAGAHERLAGIAADEAATAAASRLDARADDLFDGGPA